MDEDETSLFNRNLVLDSVKDVLIKIFGNKIVSAIVYGSTLNEDFCIKSDYDILLVVIKSDLKFLKDLRGVKIDFKNRGVEIDFNVHDYGDIPSIRKDLFWHNNRGLYVQKEFEIYGKVLIGENLFRSTGFKNIDMLKEAVRVINSLNYQARKLIINQSLEDDGNKILMMKWCIYGALYALASRGIYPIDKRVALKTFYEEFDPPINPEKFLHIKITRPTEITQEDVEVAYEFLTYLDKKIFNDYKQFSEG